MFKKLFRITTFIYFIFALCYSLIHYILDGYYSRLDLTGNKGISVIIPVRNEEKRLAPLFKSIDLQDFDNFEVLFVNDGSTDRTVEMIEEFINEKEHCHLLHAKRSDNGLTPYQNALEFGVENSSKDVILFTTAGCYFNSNLLSSLSKHYAEGIKVVSLGFAFNQKAEGLSQNLKHSLDALMSDICHLFIAAGSFVGAKGGALSFDKEAYINIGGQHTVSGKRNEDIHLTTLMHKNGYKIIGSKLYINKEADNSLKSLFSLHLRWVKGRWNLNCTIVTSFFLINNLLYLYYLANPGVMVLAKIVADYLLVSNVYAAHNIISSTFDKIILALSFPIYFVILLVLSAIPFKVKWR